MPPPLQREKIAILGGGMASLSAAFALSDTAALRERYELTVYQDGWLLGGKGASVRNREAHGRIEEHGLHVWLGYYENAFTLLRRCYEELGRPPGAALRTLRDAFIKHSSIAVGTQRPRGWEHWSVTFPETSEWPGDGRPLPSAAESIRGAARQVLRYALAWWKQWRDLRPKAGDLAETCGARARILEVTRSDVVPGPLRSVAEMLGNAIRPLDPSGQWASSIARRFTADQVTIAFLKQFRDVQHTERACYQAIIEAKATVRALRGYGPIPGTFQVSWSDHASHPFTADLGLEPGGQQALAATWADFDFVMESGREIFRA